MRNLYDRVFKNNTGAFLMLVISAFILVYLINNGQLLADARGAEYAVEASGNVEYAGTCDIVAEADGMVRKIYFSEGGNVKKGTLLVQLDDTAARQKINTLKNELMYAKVTASEARRDLEKLDVRAPFDGYVTQISTGYGSALSGNEHVLTLTDRSRLKLLVPFSSIDIGKIVPGSAAKVCVWTFMDYYEGRVAYVSKTPRYTQDGGIMYDVEIEVKNPGAFDEGMLASAEIETAEGLAKSIEAGRLAYINKLDLTAGASGIVKKVNVRENQFVEKGDILLKIENDSVVAAAQKADIRVKDLADTLAYEESLLEKCRIYSTADGSIIKTGIREGSIVKAGDVICTVADTSRLVVAAYVDVKDAAGIVVGEKARITTDTPNNGENSVIDGTVRSVGLEPVYINGLARYKVTVGFGGENGLAYGMGVKVTFEQQNNTEER